MTNKDKCVLSYLAGIIDGEGYIGLVPQGSRTNKENHPSYRPMIIIMMNDAVGLLLIKELFPEFQFYSRKGYGGRINCPYEIKIDGWDCYDFLKKIKPFLIVKHEQAALLCSYLSWKRKILGEKKQTSELTKDENYWKRSKWFCDTIREKKKPYNGVNSVKLLNQLDLRQYRAKLEEVEKIREGVTTRVRQLDDMNANKPISAPEQDIV